MIEFCTEEPDGMTLSTEFRSRGHPLIPKGLLRTAKERTQASHRQSSYLIRILYFLLSPDFCTYLERVWNCS